MLKLLENNTIKSSTEKQSSAIVVHKPKRTATSTRTIHTRQLSYSLAKRLVDLMVEPMSFDRICNLGKSLTTKARLKEEVSALHL